MASGKIFILFGLLALGFLIPSKVAATARDIGTKPSSGRDEAITNPVISMVTEADQSSNQNHKSMNFHVKGGPTVTKMNLAYGRCLLNLEYVRINNIDGEDPGNLYGTVTVDDGLDTFTFYNRSSDDYENVDPGGFATLTDSSNYYSLSGAEPLTISVDLYDQDTFSSDDNIARGTIVWDPDAESVTFENYDKHLEQVVTGEDGDVTVGYSVLSNARDVIIKLGVTIHVILENGDEEMMPEVYGTLRELLRFSKVRLDQVLSLCSGGRQEVWRGQPIPLTRTVIVASTSTNLTIMADLWDFDAFLPDDGIAQGSADFAVVPGTQWQYIYGKFGQVKVIITC